MAAADESKTKENGNKTLDHQLVYSTEPSIQNANLFRGWRESMVYSFYTLCEVSHDKFNLEATEFQYHP